MRAPPLAVVLALVGLAPAANLAPIPPQKLDPGQSAVSKPDKNGLVVVLRPIVTHVAPGDPFRFVLHHATEAGPITMDHAQGKLPVRRDEHFASLTFTVTTPDGTTHTLKPDFKPTPPPNGVKIHQPLFETATQVLTLKDTGVVANSVSSATYLSPTPVDVTNAQLAAWVAKPKVSFDAPGKYTIVVSGTLTPEKGNPILFASAELRMERLADKTGVKSQAELVKMLTDAVQNESPKTKFAPGSFVIEDSKGNRTVRVRTPPDELKWGGCDVFTAKVDAEGKLGRVERTVAGGCVAAGTLVLGETGPVAIETVRVGDRIRGFDPDAGKQVWVTVKAVWPARAGETLVLGDTLRVTGNHPLYANGAWKDAAAVKPTDTLLTTEGKKIPAGEPKRVVRPVDVFDLTVDGPHTFFAGGFLVHNKSVAFRPSDLSRTQYFLLWPEELKK